MYLNHNVQESTAKEKKEVDIRDREKIIQLFECKVQKKIKMIKS